jgi:hypothetical protein
MVIWEIWKEWNRHSFRNQRWTTGKIKEAIIAMTREMVQSRNCQTGGAQLTDRYLRILEAFQLKGGHKPNQVRQLLQLQIGESNWKPPPKGSLKLNFDGASKGNPGWTSTGGVIKDNQGNIIRLYTGVWRTQPTMLRNLEPWRPALRYFIGKG